MCLAAGHRGLPWITQFSRQGFILRTIGDACCPGGPLHVIIASLRDKLSDNRPSLGRTLADSRRQHLLAAEVARTSHAPVVRIEGVIWSLRTRHGPADVSSSNLPR